MAKTQTTSFVLAFLLLLFATSPMFAQDQSTKSSETGDAELYFNEGLEHYKAGRYKDAVEIFKKVIGLKSKDARVHNYLGDAYFNLDRYPEAISAYKQAIEIKPDYAAAYNNLAAVYLTLSDYKEAIKFFTLAIQHEPEYALAHYNLGMAYLKNGDRNAALEQQMVLNTVNREMAYKLAVLINRAGKPVAGIVFNGKPVALPEPEYSQTAETARFASTVAVVVTIDESGKVISARCLRGGHPLLREASLKAALKTRFTPATVAGRPVKVTGMLKYDFIPGERPRPKLPSHVSYISKLSGEY